MSVTLRILKLLLIAVAILLGLFAAFVGVTLIIDQPRVASLVILIMLSSLLLLAVCWAIVFEFARRRQAGAVLTYLEQAVRLNLPLPRIVGALAESQHGRFARDLSLAREQLEQGASLTTVLQVIPGIPPRVIGLVASAERSGRLSQVLSRLMEQRRAAISSGRGFIPFYRTYALVLGLALITVTSMLMIFVMPKYEQIFRDFHTQLPAVTVVTLSVSRSFTNEPWWPMLLAVVVIAIVLNALLGRLRGGVYGIVETPMARLMSYIPWIGRVRTHRALGDVFQCAADAIESGRPIETSLLEAGQVCGNARVRSQIDEWVSAMSQGAAIPDAARHAGLPHLVSGMLSTAIQTPDLAQVLRFLGRYYSTRFSRAIALLEASMVPLIAISMGFLVCWVALSIFAPMISLIQTVSSPAPRGL
jgi:type II secretory pathway component PulF